MAGSINHVFVSTVPDEGVSTEVGPDEWNDGLVVSGGTDGQVMVRRTSAPYGWELITLGAPVADSNVTQAANSGTAETDLHSYTLAANKFDVNKRAIRITARGSFAANANVKTLRFKLGGGAAIVLNPVTTSPNGVRFKVEVVVVRTGSDAQSVFIESLVGLAAYDLSSLTARTEDDGLAIIAKFTGESGTASSDILMDYSYVESLN